VLRFIPQHNPLLRAVHVRQKRNEMDKFSAMKAFVRVVEAGSFTKAADSLGVPKAQVTRLVQSLERELKALLLNRTTRRMTVTADGAAYYERAARVLEDVEELESSMSHAKVSPRGRLRVDTPPQIANLILVPALDDFCTRYPDIEIEIGVSDKPVDLIGENVDCVIRVGEIADQSLVARRIGDMHVISCASPAYLKRYGVPKHPLDLERDGHRAITYFSHAGARFNYVLVRGEERCEVNLKSVISVNETGTMLAAGLAGLGIVRTATFMAAPYLAAGTLQRILPEWTTRVWPIYVVYPPNRHVSAKVRVFIDWVVELFAQALQAPEPLKAQAGRAVASNAPQELT
jgi:DNA-binding transcriptional LysR family regulator